MNIVGGITVLMILGVGIANGSPVPINLKLIEGSYTLVSDRKAEDYKGVLECMEFTPENITLFQEHATSGNFEIKVINNDNLEVEIICDTPTGKHSKTLKQNADGSYQEGKLWDGRTIKQRIEFEKFNDQGGVMHVYKRLEGLFDCNWEYQLKKGKDSIVIPHCRSMRTAAQSGEAHMKYKHEGGAGASSGTNAGADAGASAGANAVVSES